LQDFGDGAESKAGHFLTDSSAAGTQRLAALGLLGWRRKKKAAPLNA
jgi:hypothetical protein